MYYGCIDNPECDFMVWQKPSKETCPKCDRSLYTKGISWSVWRKTADM